MLEQAFVVAGGSTGGREKIPSALAFNPPPKNILDGAPNTLGRLSDAALSASRTGFFSGEFSIIASRLGMTLNVSG